MLNNTLNTFNNTLNPTPDAAGRISNNTLNREQVEYNTLHIFFIIR